MTELGRALAQAADRFVGVPFRLHGRDPATGLDCVGLVAVALRAIGREPAVPAGYTLRQMAIAHHLPAVGGCGLVDTEGALGPGDVLLAKPGPAQHHLLVVSDACRVIHAHAGLRRVIRGPLPVDWPILRHWRLVE